MIFIHRFVLEYIEEFLNSEDCSRLLLLGQNKIVLNVSDEDVINKGLLSIDIRDINSKFYKISRISVSANYFNPKNYLLSPVIVGDCQVNLVHRGSDNLLEMLIKKNMGPHHVNCGTIYGKRINFEDSNTLNLFKHGFNNCELILESIYNINLFNHNYCFDNNNIYYFKHLIYNINYNYSLSSLSQINKELSNAYIIIKDFIDNFNSKIIIDKCELILKHTDLKTVSAYNNILNVVKSHLEYMNNNIDFISNSKITLNFVIEEIDPVIDYYKALDTEVFKLNKINSQTYNRVYEAIYVIYTFIKGW